MDNVKGVEGLGGHHFAASKGRLEVWIYLAEELQVEVNGVDEKIPCFSVGGRLRDSFLACHMENMLLAVYQSWLDDASNIGETLLCLLGWVTRDVVAPL